MAKDIPIIFSGPMVRALLEGRKTRRILKPQLFCHSHKDWPDKPEPVPSIDDEGVHCEICGAGISFSSRNKSGVTGIPVRYRAGDRLWVREAVARIDNSEFGKPSYWQYRADTNGREFAGDWPAEAKDDPERPRWRPAIHMPREASRLTLICDGVKVERLQDISDDDARAEGVDAISMLDVPRQAAWSHRGDFAQLWNKLHGQSAWDTNPFVVAITFRVIKANIDAPQARAA